MSSIDKAIVRLTKLCEKYSNGNYIHAEWIGITNIEAMVTLLDELEKKEAKILNLNWIVERRNKESKKQFNKIDKLEQEKRDLIDGLEEDIRFYEDSDTEEWGQMSKKEYAEELLNMLKGENK